MASFAGHGGGCVRGMCGGKLLAFLALQLSISIDFHVLSSIGN